MEHIYVDNNGVWFMNDEGETFYIHATIENKQEIISFFKGLGYNVEFCY